MAKTVRSPAQQRIARSIAIRRGMALQSASPRQTASARKALPAAVGRITMILVDGWSKNGVEATLHVFDDVAQIQRELRLDCVEGLATEIAEEAVDGTVYAAFDPHSADIRDARTLIIASNADELEQRHDLACEEI